MNDRQFDQFMKKFHVVLKQELQIFKEEMRAEIREELADNRGKIDWMMGAIDTNEKERLALGFNFDRKHKDHERRITALESTAGS